MKGNADELSELRGLQLRSPGPIYNDVIEEIGAVAVTLPVSDLYDSMDRGIVTGSFMAPSALISFRLIEVTDTVIELDLYTTPFIFFMNIDRWNGIAPQDQEAIMALLDAFPEKIGKQYDEEIKHAMALAEEEGLNIVRFSDEDLAAFHEAVDPLVQGWIAELEAAGKPGQELYELVLQYADQYE
jgi:TRAP-type C4-dicarboxylate transport system substrate-binding protein